MGLVDLIMPWRQVVLAKRQLEAGEFRVAKECLSAVSLGRLPRDKRAGALLLKAWASAGLSQSDKAIEQVQGAVDLGPTVNVLCDLLPSIHSSLSSLGRNQAALDVLDIALKIAGEDEGLRMRRCNTLLLLNRESEASAGFRLALARNANCSEALLGMATLAARKESSAKDAVKYCMRALRASPPLIDVTGIHEQLLHTLSRAWIISGEADTCVEYFTDMPPEVGWVRAYGLALGLSQGERKNEAVGTLLSAIRDDEHHPYIFQLLCELSGVLVSPLRIWEVTVRLDWLGSDMPSLQGMLPKSLFRTYHIGELDEDSAVKWIGQTLPPRLFDPELEVISVRHLRDFDEGYTGPISMMPVKFESWADG